MRKTVFGFVLLLISLSSCEDFFSATKEVDLGEFSGDMTVVGRLINTDLDTVEDFNVLSHLGVLVSRSKSVLDTARFKVIENAEIILSGSDGLMTPLEFDDALGLYLPSSGNSEFQRISVNENTRYELSVDLPGEERMTAVSETESFGDIQSINIIQNDIDGDENTILDRVQIEINDPAGENFYLLRVLYNITNIGRDGEEYTYARSGYLYNYSSVFDESPELFSDDLFDGQTEVLEFWSERYVDQINEMGDPEVPSEAIVFLWSLSKEEYEFRKSLQANRDAEENPFAEPSIIFSNIQNGIGVFSMSKVDRFVIPWQ